MHDLNDPEMKEIVHGFCDESEKLFDELEGILEEIEDDIPGKSHLLEKFGQVIDRIMGAAGSLGENDIAKFCELGKIIGYKSSQVKEEALLEICVSILFDSLDLLRKMIVRTRNGDDSKLKDQSPKAFITRLQWLSDKFKSIDRASVSVPGSTAAAVGGDDELDQSEIDDLLDDLGLV